MKPVLIQPTGPIDYPHLDKPVHFTPEFLASLTGQHSFEVHNEHHGPLLTTTSKLFYMGGGLYAIFDDEIKTNNKGFSTVFDAKELIEYDDHYEPVNCPILTIDQSSNPRNLETFLYNSSTIVKNIIKKDGDNLTEEEKTEKTPEPSTSKDEKIGALKYETNNHKDKINLLKKDLKTKDDELNNISSDKEKLKDENKKLADKLKTYEDAEKAKAEQLAQTLARNNNELLETYKKLSVDELETIKVANESHDKYIAEKQSKENPYKGVAGSTATEQKESNKKEEKEDDSKLKRESFDDWKRTYGVY